MTKNKPNEKLEKLGEISTKRLKVELENRTQGREITKEIIKIIAGTTAITLGALLAPQATAAICKIIYNQHNRKRYNRDKVQIKQTLYRLKEQEVISLGQKNGETTISLTQEGRKKLLKYRLDDLALPHPQEWDGLWRIVLFDIPENKRGGRDLLRSSIKRLGMYQLQQSAWIYPYPCKDEVDFIGAYSEIGKYILYIETKTLENESYFLALFNLRRQNFPNR